MTRTKFTYPTVVWVRKALSGREIVLLVFSEAQKLSHMFVEDCVHEMCVIERFGSVRLNPNIDVRIFRINIYHDLCHGILSVLQRMMLDNIPSTLRMMRTKAT